MSAVKQDTVSRLIPLAERMRPRTLDEIVGQDEIIGPTSSFGAILRTHGFPIPSVVLWGPPGSGKTTVARVIAETSNYRFLRLSGVLDGVKELREAVTAAEEAMRCERRPTLALVDEIHRFNRSQQDAFLPHVESGVLTVIGQTTENVSFRLRSALLSRLRVVQLKPLTPEVIATLLNRALSDCERGLGEWGLEITDEANNYLARLAMGDARRALTGLEWAASLARSRNERVLSRAIVEEAFGSQPGAFDQEGDYHYDTVSAFIKSLRGSDPEAALYYMLRALDGGEDPLFITRRMIIFASEDASCDPRALEIAINVDRAVERVGLPEGRIPLAQAAIYLSCCSKSNASYRALRDMEQVVAKNPDLAVPLRLRNAPTELMKDLQYGKGYHYPHDYPAGFYPERYLPEELGNLVVYKPTDRGLDAQIKERLDNYREMIIARKS